MVGKRIEWRGGEEQALAPLIMADCTQGLTHAPTERANDVTTVNSALKEEPEEAVRSRRGG